VNAVSLLLSRLRFRQSGRFSSLRYRLLTLVLVPLVLLSGTVILLASKWSSDYTYEQLFTKVNTDLRVARDSFFRIQSDGQRELSWLAHSAALTRTLAAGDTRELNNLLKRQRELSGFDFLKLLSADGSQVLLDARWQAHDLRNSPLNDSVLNDAIDAQSASGATGIEIYQAEEWQREAGVDAQTVLLPLVETARAAPSQRNHEDRAMIIRTLQPVFNSQGIRVALLEAGLLLNRNFAFVDQIRDLVYGPGSLAPGSRGTVTVFLEDVRITTNVPTSDESRALGTRVSAEVRDTVLTQGVPWVDRAFVVNDWYISAYEPIIDVAGQRVGMLYAGYLEAPFREQLFTAITILSALVLAGSLLAMFAAIAGARAIFTPIETMTSVVRATAAGEHRRIGPIPTGNEIGELASQFDSMLDTLEVHRDRIEKDTLLLEEKVQHRTAELEMQNRRLQDSIDLLHQTRRQLANAEKLAALGELTAGVAHEINNPTAVILGNMDVLIADMGESREKVRTEIDLIIEQVYRIRSITDRLLKYSRFELHNQHESGAGVGEGAKSVFSQGISLLELSPGSADLSPANTEAVPLQSVIADTLKLLTHEFDGRQIQVHQSHQGELFASIDRQELQQVLVNLLSNAIQAINQDGRIDINTSDNTDNTVSILIRDSGCGIDPQHVQRVFDPFFTSGKVRGTGLGLSVSYGIVRRFSGDIRVQSMVDTGSEFEVILPGVPARSRIRAV